MTNDQIPWPKKNDKLFVDNPADSSRHFCIGPMLPGQDASAFKAAADIIVDTYKKSRERDDLVRPVAYLYRHCFLLELSRRWLMRCRHSQCWPLHECYQSVYCGGDLPTRLITRG